MKCTDMNTTNEVKYILLKKSTDGLESHTQDSTTAEQILGGKTDVCRSN